MSNYVVKPSFVSTKALVMNNLINASLSFKTSFATFWATRNYKTAILKFCEVTLPSQRCPMNALGQTQVKL